MTATCFYKRAQTVLDGILAARIPPFSEALRARGYSAISVARHASAAQHFVAWVLGAGVAPDAIDDAVVDGFACHTCANRADQAQGFSPAYMGRVRAFVRYLREARIVVRPVVPTAPGAFRVAAFQGLVESSSRRLGRDDPHPHLQAQDAPCHPRKRSRRLRCRRDPADDHHHRRDIVALSYQKPCRDAAPLPPLSGRTGRVLGACRRGDPGSVRKRHRYVAAPPRAGKG